MTDDPKSTLTLHKECYVGVVPPDRVDGLVGALHELDIADDAIDVFLGGEGGRDYREVSPHRIDESGWKSLVRNVLGFDQVEVERTYVKALRDGEPVIRACVPEDEESLRADVEEALLAHGGSFIHYFGQWSFVEVASDAERVDRAG